MVDDPLTARFREARAMVTDWDRVGFLFVVIPAPLPILATRRAVDPLERCGACGGS